ncbi:two-component system response regulator [Bifidobacterium actinocoloniiforme DSM 22766]|uniref:Two-component system response regulator n=1 Tax=Bifidobacterium actinocoloniiforme DSM 22766 TaxID=1437605 RepID=A0A086Z1A4_9BIFI|nr:response regulator transcription factor [Bifidobacterium actinocoloniiforme]AKV55464.1 XRE family transcriptional regulator [Bifidobacterium actinocoloniiforme DSM 22766]KFI40304.1 two-component system response regulator [Bifidobacterium actinocoloniiforme DSM 22766]
MTRILVVEDHRDIQNLLADVLGADYELSQALSGPEAIAKFSENEPDLVLLDLMLPGVTGESVLGWIRKVSAVPVIVLTAVQDKSRTVALLHKGANDYLTKPFDIDELRARVEVQLRGRSDPGQREGRCLSFEDLTLDLDAHQVNLGDSPVPLPKKEFALLALMIKRPHQVFDKASLYEAVWERSYINAENTLNVHLSNLRTKLNEAAGRPRFVVSVWGIGVRLV